MKSTREQAQKPALEAKEMLMPGSRTGSRFITGTAHRFLEHLIRSGFSVTFEEMRFVPIIFLGLFLSSCAKPEAPTERRDDKLEGTILFLGDNLTHSGEFIAYLDAFLYSESTKTISAARHSDLINLGLPTETCSGLFEPGRDFPRPVVHERLERALEMVEPDTVFVCYGTLDGVYSPFSEERFAAFKDGITSIVERVHAANANVVLMTPPPFDMEPCRGKEALQPASAEVFGYWKVYENYDQEVIAKYSEWILQQKDEVEQVIDLRSPLLSYLQEKRSEDPTFTFLGNGMKPDEDAHEVIAKTILSALGRDANLLDSVWRRHKVRSKERQEILHPAWLSHVGYSITERPKSLQEGLPLEEAMARADEVAWEIEREFRLKRQ